MARNVALLIGNTEYDHLSSLKCCANDVAQMHRLLLATQKFSQIVGFVDQPIALVTDEIRRISEADEGTEEVFLFFSGHGVSNSDDFYMCFKGFQESAPNTTGLSRAETYELIRMFSAKQSVVVIDACEAGRNIIKNDVPPLARALKSGFTDFVQFSSCTENQNSQGGDWVSVFTDEFIKSCLKKERGPIYYLDVENALRDAFLSNSEQTPHFIRQGTSQEKFCNDACRLDEFRKTYLARIDNDSEQVEAESIGSSFASAKAAIEDIDAQVPAKKSAQAFIDEVFQTTLKKSELTPELSDFFEARTVQYDTFEHVGNLRSVVNLLARRGGSDSFVESVVERKRRRPISLYDYSAWASLGMLAEYDETYDLLNHCELASVHVGIYFQPKFMALNRVFSEIVFLPRLTECLVLTCNSIERRSGWETFSELDGKKKWEWSNHGWSESPIKVAEKYVPDPYEYTKAYVLSFCGQDS